jgi:Ala-tRNA(Pro) deacylase
VGVETGFQAVTDYLEREGVAFEVVEHARTESAAAEARAVGLPPGDVAKTVVLREGDSVRLAVIPASHRLDLQKVRDVLGASRGLRLVSESEMAADFGDFEVGALPPLAPLLDAVELMDERLLEHDRVLFAGGDHEHGVLVDPRDLAKAGQARVADLCED